MVAISIPIFNSQLEKSREATDLANLRAAYAECSATVLSGEEIATAGANGVTCTLSNGNYTATKTVALKQKNPKWQTGDVEVGGVTLDKDKLTALTEVTVSVKDDGTVPTFMQGNPAASIAK